MKHEYRVVPYGDGYEPQMKYTMGRKDGTCWFPLNVEGYWLEPDAFNDGEVTMHISMPESVAKRAIVRATAINGENLTPVLKAAGSGEATS